MRPPLVLNDVYSQLGVTAYSKLRKDQLVDKLVVHGGGEVLFIPTIETTSTLAVPTKAGNGSTSQGPHTSQLPGLSSTDPMGHLLSSSVFSCDPPAIKSDLMMSAPPPTKTTKNRPPPEATTGEDTSTPLLKKKRVTITMPVTGEGRDWNEDIADVSVVIKASKGKVIGFNDPAVGGDGKVLSIPPVHEKVRISGVMSLKSLSLWMFGAVSQAKYSTKVSHFSHCSSSMITPATEFTKANPTALKNTMSGNPKQVSSFKPVATKFKLPSKSVVHTPSTSPKRPIAQHITTEPLADITIGTRPLPSRRPFTTTRTSTFKPVTLTLGPRKIVATAIPAPPPINSKTSFDFLYSEGIPASPVSDIVSSSWLGRMSRAVSARPLIDPSLLATADLATLDVVTRFIIARIHTSFQASQWDDIVSPLTVVGARPASSYTAEIWVITTKGKREGMKNIQPKAKIRQMMSKDNDNMQCITVLHLVVGSTGDVVATQRVLIDGEASLNNSIDTFSSLREDWHAMLSANANHSNLFSCIKTKNDPDYPHGISKTWSKRAIESGEKEEIRVAERYVLSNVLLSR